MQGLTDYYRVHRFVGCGEVRTASFAIGYVSYCHRILRANRTEGISTHRGLSVVRFVPHHTLCRIARYVVELPRKILIGFQI